jgi:DNA-binding NarL/FixJ family response regulator
VRILIADDHPEIRKALRRLLSAEGWDVCGEAADGPDAIAAVRRLAPDVVIVDLFMPGMSGLDAAREMRRDRPALLIMLMTSLDSSIEVAAREAGIQATVSKLAGNKVVRGIHAMLRGEEFHELSEP